MYICIYVYIYIVPGTRNAVARVLVFLGAISYRNPPGFLVLGFPSHMLDPVLNKAAGS